MDHSDQPITRGELHEELARHADAERMVLKMEIERVLFAFPDGIEGHRGAHMAMIKAAKAQEEFWQGLRADIAKKSIWGILQILLILLAAGMAAKLGLVFPGGKP